MISISVIIPVYNSEKYIISTVKSVLNQTLLPNEIIIINDGSTDKSLEVLKELEKDNKIISIVNQENAGPSITRNTGVRLAKYDWVCFVDSDDILHPQRLEIASSFTNNIDAVICEYFRFKDGDSIKFPKYDIPNIIDLDIPNSNKSVIKYGYGLPRMLMKKESFLKTGGIDINLINNEDHEFHFRMISHKMNFRKINLPLYFYRQHKSKFRLSNQNSRSHYTYKALYKMYNQTNNLPQNLQLFAIQEISNRIAHNALKNIIQNPSKDSFKHITFAQSINRDLKPYNKVLLNIISKLFGIGYLERIIGKLNQRF